MKLSDYIPHTIVYDFMENRYRKYSDVFILNIGSELYSITFDLYGDNFIFIKYRNLNFSKKDVVIYDGKFDNIEDLIKICVLNFNSRIGNINDFVDTYRRRNLILKDLI